MPKLKELDVDYEQIRGLVYQLAFENEVKMAMAVKLFEMKRLSSGMAASLVGIDRVSFLLTLHSFNVPMIDLEEEELFLDIQNA